MDALRKLRDELQGLAALHTSLARADGYKIDKKASRFSAMADYMMHVGSCSSPFSESAARFALSEAVRTGLTECPNGEPEPMNIPGVPFDRELWRWMEAQADGRPLTPYAGRG